MLSVAILIARRKSVTQLLYYLTLQCFFEIFNFNVYAVGFPLVVEVFIR